MSSNTIFSFRPKIRHFVALAIFIPSMLIALYTVVIKSDSYECAYQFVMNDPAVVAELGEVKRGTFDFWQGIEFAPLGSNGHADYSFEITTERGNFSIATHLRMVSGVWRVTAADVRLPMVP